MSEVVIRAENVYKEYNLGTIGYGALYQDLQSWWARIRGKDDPNAAVSLSGKKDYKSGKFYALSDVSFDINRGDLVGIIGRNGAGKSTLLKILSRITTPTKGQIKIKGRIASLLEVGTGFHAELTGRENIYLNGTILGMKKREIDRKLDEIVAFAGIEEFIDTPVKRYSSGMYVRLAFSVAAHLDSDILILDEVLAVGDAEFQKKCLGKMDDVAKNQGRTVLFVSHNMGAVKNLCNVGMLLRNGVNVKSGDIQDVINEYMVLNQAEQNKLSESVIYNNKAIISALKYFSGGHELNNDGAVLMGDSLEIEIDIDIFDKVNDLSISIDIRDQYDDLISHLTNEDGELYFSPLAKSDKKKVFIKTEPINLSPSIYYLTIWIGMGHKESIQLINKALRFVIEQSDIVHRTRPLPGRMKVFISSEWKAI
ncbi:MAG TPA: polysaccharide ABC transporter ATP-binding protein [Spirochaetota bacterium]|jgi:lipopolysaccharide transport system ATP-binding protein|nr:MAG: Teichoic acids export ATP-binding protein TagH [Spirochaetes bacterium ADurb.Bin133]HNZ27042.1 polysaccharide ABC transporter ATP-binding protein [Spirochaetota bacterium]HPY88280.1 polysaccharide ABC transporter ATP-binding protein [Spirochaetota bacterium]HQB61274.1 polysaccharide ABC transporter ATP-binding protein [Spirochaetota bacterium]